MKKFSPLFLALSLSALVTTGVQAASVVSGGSGNWANSGTNTPWGSPYTPPTSADTAFIRNNATVTVNTNVGSILGLTVGESTAGTPPVAGSGTLQIDTGGSLTVSGTVALMRRSNQNTAVGVINLNGGTFSHTGTMWIGGPGVSATANSSGTLNISGASTLTSTNHIVVGSASAAVSTGLVNVIGSNANITGTSFSLNAAGTLKFTLDSTGISDMVYSGAVSFVTGSTLTIDGTAFGGAAGNYTLIDGATLTGFDDLNITYTGFNPGYTPIVNFDSGTQSLVLNVTGVPEPSTYAMVGAGLAAVLFGLRRKRQA